MGFFDVIDEFLELVEEINTAKRETKKKVKETMGYATQIHYELKKVVEYHTRIKIKTILGTQTEGNILRVVFQGKDKAMYKAKFINKNLIYVKKYI